jgi:predicted nucleic acid-binding protein
MPGDFLDSNVLVYAFTEDPRTVTARALLARGCTISIQGLNEFTNVARRKLGKSWDEIHDALAVIRNLCPTIFLIDLDTHETGLRLAERHGFAFFDALMSLPRCGPGAPPCGRRTCSTACSSTARSASPTRSARRPNVEIVDYHSG